MRKVVSENGGTLPICHSMAIRPAMRRIVSAMRQIGRATPIIVLLTGCTSSGMAVYSRPGGAEVFLDGTLAARTVNEVTPVRLKTPAGKHVVLVNRDGYQPWEREVDVPKWDETAILADLVIIPPPPPHMSAGALEISTEPGGVNIFLDEKEIGFSRPTSGEPMRVENIVSGHYALRLERPGYQSLKERYEILPGSTTRVVAKLFPLVPYYAFPSNDDLLRQTAIRAVRGVAHMPGMKSSKTIALVNLEGDVDGLNSLRPLLEDVLIAELARNGRGVAERDDHLLVRLANESARGDSLVLEVMTRHGGRNKPFLYDARLQSSANAVAVLTTDSGHAQRRILIEDQPVAEIRLPTANQILGYKVIEKTLRIDPADPANATEPMVRREVIIRLFVRLLDARTGIVEWAERMEGSAVDFVPQRVYRWLETPPSRMYAYSEVAHADQALAASDDDSVPVEVFTPADLNRIGDVDAVFWYYRHMGEAHLRAGRIEEAVRDLRQAVHFRPNDYESRMFLAEALTKNGQLEEAGKHYLEALQGVAKSE